MITSILCVATNLATRSYPRDDEALMILRVHHAQVSIPKNSEVAAREFYCGILGLKEILKPESLKARGGFWVQLGEIQIHFGVEDGVDRRATRSHLAYEVDSIAKWRSCLKEKGIETLESDPIPGLDRFELRDPFGNRIEMLQRL